MIKCYASASEDGYIVAVPGRSPIVAHVEKGEVLVRDVPAKIGTRVLSVAAGLLPDHMYGLQEVRLIDLPLEIRDHLLTELDEWVDAAYRLIADAKLGRLPDGYRMQVLAEIAEEVIKNGTQEIPINNTTLEVRVKNRIPPRFLVPPSSSGTVQ